MNYRTCKCGKYQQWDSGIEFGHCQGCDVCGTTAYKNNLGEHIIKSPHEVIVKYNKDTGIPYLRCKNCYKKIDEEEDLND